MIGRRGLEKARTRLFLRNVLILGSSVSYAAILLLAANGSDGRNNVNAAFTRPSFGSVARCERTNTSGLSLSVASAEDCKNIRARNTPADLYFQKHKEIPKPKIMHATLDPNPSSTLQKNILVIGDVHGCFDELLLLHQTALEENGAPFRYVILVGDLCMKGPDSAKVVRYVREKNWLAVRGNHDNAVLEAALGDSSRRSKKKYKWVMNGENGIANNNQVTLSDEDVKWLAELPYTLTIPAALLQADSNESSEVCLDTTIVHAGLVPGVELKDQSIETMVTIREVDPIYNHEKIFNRKGTLLRYTRHGAEMPLAKHEIRGDRPVPWASAWKGPNQVVFGHDARRGLQLFDTKWATGLDTGAVYGKQLTGIILPDRRLVQVDALKEHSPVG